MDNPGLLPLLRWLQKQSRKPCCCLRAFLFGVLSVGVLLLASGCSSYHTSQPLPEKLEYQKTGLASYYAKKFHSRKTASGEIFNNELMTAGHQTLPFGTQVIVKNVSNGKSVKVTINDRGPYIKNRIIDLTRAAFAKIEDLKKGLARVEIMVVE